LFIGFFIFGRLTKYPILGRMCSPALILNLASFLYLLSYARRNFTIAFLNLPIFSYMLICKNYYNHYGFDINAEFGDINCLLFGFCIENIKTVKVG